MTDLEEIAPVDARAASADEYGTLLRWRRGQLIGLGFSFETAQSWAERNEPYLVGNARQLIAGGCSLEEAKRILE